LEIVSAGLIGARCPFLHSANSVRALKVNMYSIDDVENRGMN